MLSNCNGKSMNKACLTKLSEENENEKILAFIADVVNAPVEKDDNIEKLRNLINVDYFKFASSVDYKKEAEAYVKLQAILKK